MPFTPPADATRYDLRVAIDAGGQLQVSGRVDATHGEDGPIVFLLSPAMRDLVLEREDAAGARRPVAVKRVAGVGWGDVWQLDEPPARGRFTLHLRYRSAADARSFHGGSDGAWSHGDTTAWYPLFDGHGLAGHVGTLAFDAPAGWRVAASGVDAGSAPDRGRYAFRIDRPTVFSFAAAPFTVVRHADGATPIVAYLRTPRADAAHRLARVSEILGVLADEFGPYPFDELTVVEVPKPQAKMFIMASASQMVLVPTPYLDGELDVPDFAHEIAHKWWGGLVVDRGSGAGILLTEGMAQLGALLAVERVLGPAAATRMRRDGPIRPSGSYQVETCLGYPVPLESLRGYLALVALGQARPLAAGGGDLGHPLATSKGMLVLDLLRRTVGRDRFRRAVHGFLAAHAFRDVPWATLRDALSTATGTDLTWFHRQWLERDGAPELTLRWTAVPGGIAIEIDQAEPTYRVALELELTGAARRERRTIDVDGARTSLRLDVGWPVTGVTLDPDLLVPRWTPDLRAEAAKLAACPREP